MIGGINTNKNYRTDTNGLRKLMIDKGILTITELSEKSGINRNTVSLVLKGEIQPSSDVMFKLADTLEMCPQVAGAIFFTQNLRDT